MVSVEITTVGLEPIIGIKVLLIPVGCGDIAKLKMETFPEPEINSLDN